MPRLLVASRNSDKLREIQNKFRGIPIQLLNLADFSFVHDVIEDQPDLYGNAIKKAFEVWKQTNLWTLADDTGLEVEALNGEPGVLSARYSGAGATYKSNCEELLTRMKGIPSARRTACFRTIICLRTDNGLFCVEGALSGTILTAPRGAQGFGYDPIFGLGDGRALAELSLDEKNSLSHRAVALEKLASLLPAILNLS